jgi:hypothetical protein
MSLFEDIFGKGDAFYGAPAFEPVMTPQHLDLMRRALALHPGADPYFNLQPTIEMLETADMYGLEVSRPK